MILSAPPGIAVTGGAPAIADVVRYWPALIPQGSSLSSFTVLAQAPDEDEPGLVAESEKLPWPKTGGSPDVDLGPRILICPRC